MRDTPRRAIEGAVAGTLATVPMTAVMFATQRLGLLGQQPPQKITDTMLARAEVSAPPEHRRVLAALAHLGFGAAAGALFAALRSGRPSARRAMLEGAAYGTAVWAGSYAGWVPALGIMPPPQDDRPGRPASMVVAHWVFGATLGLVVATARGRRARR